MNKPWRPDEAIGTPTSAAGAQHRSIVFLGSAHDNGGSSILASSLAKAMRAQGHHVEEWYLFGSHGGMPGGTRVFMPGPRSPIVLPTLFLRVLRALREAAPDAVFGLQSLSNLMVATAGRLAGIRQRIATLHNPLDRQNNTLMMLDGILGRRGAYSHIIACGQSVADSFAKNGPTYAKHLDVIANGYARPSLVDRDTARRKLGLPLNGTMFGQIGRLCEQKNQSFNLAVLQQMPDATLLMVGSGPDEAKLKAEIAERVLESRVHMIANLPHGQIGLFYSAVDTVLFPSRFEGLSLAAIEAIHCGVPLLCADIPSFREMFRASPQLAADVLLPDEPAAWAGQLRTILSDSDRRTTIVDGLMRLSPAFDFDTMARRYLRLLETPQA